MMGTSKSLLDARSTGRERVGQWLPMDRPWEGDRGQSRTVLVFAVAPLWTPHFETEIEIIAGHRACGDDVRVVTCEAELPSCLANPDGLSYYCVTCRSRADRGLELVGIGPGRDRLELADPSPPRFETLGELANYRHRGAAIGRGVLSSLISIVRDPEPDLDQHRDLVERLSASAIAVYDAAVLHLERHQPDLVYVFNGRFASTLPMVEACRAAGVSFVTHEAGYELGTYRLIRDGSVHELDVVKQAMDGIWESSDLPVERREEIGRMFFTGKRYGGEGDAPDEFQFARAQRAGNLPAELQVPAERRIAIFNSSEDEFAAIMSFENPVFHDQMEALEEILAHAWPDSWSIVVRVHPNLRGVHNRQTERLEALRLRPNVHVIPADSPVDSYALIDASDVVVTFGSTIGAEAIYWGKPSVLVGRAYWEDIGALRPRSREEVMRTIGDPTLPPADGRDILRYGFFQRRWSVPFERFEQTSFRTLRYGGVVVRPSRLAQVRSLIVQGMEAARQPEHRAEFRSRLVRAGRDVSSKLRGAGAGKP